ncbi:hypothetical protein [Nocardiopsis nanhaiensis]
MTYPHHPPYPPQAAPPRIDAKELRPGRIWYAVGAGILTLGIIGGIVGFIASVASAVSLPEFETRIADSSEETFVLEDGDVNIGLFAAEGGAEGDCRITDPDGQKWDFGDPGYGHHGNHDDVRWDLVGVFNGAEAGEYLVECRYTGNEAEFAVADVGGGEDDIMSGAAVGLVLMLGLPSAGLAIGVPTMIVTGVRRGRHKRRLMAERAQGFHSPGPQYG